VAVAFAAPTAAHGSPPPTVEADVDLQGVVITSVGRLGQGPVRLHLRGRQLAAPHTVAVIELKPGVTADDVRAADVGGLQDAGEIERLGRLVAGGDVWERHDHVTTIKARAREHAVVDVTSNDQTMGSFHVDHVAGRAALPRSTATFAMHDRGFVVPPSLPADGVLRIVNQGELAHQAVAWRLNARTSVRGAVQAVGTGRPLWRYGDATVLSGLVSGHTVNRVEVRLRRGRYLLVSFYNELAPSGRSDIRRGLVAAMRVH